MYSLWKTLFFFVVVLQATITDVGANTGIASCESLIGTDGLCPVGSVCFRRLTLMMRQCNSYLGDDTECKMECRSSLTRVLQKFPGIEDALKKCECKVKYYDEEGKESYQDDYDCITARERFLRCKSHRKVPILQSCTQVKRKCLEGVEDTKCGKKFENYFNSCTDLYQKGVCTTQCKLAYKELVGNKFGKYFHKCICDGSYDEEKFCLEKTQLRKSLCMKV